MALLKPDIMIKTVTALTPELLGRHGIRGLILDVDNTLSGHHSQQPLDGVENWIEVMRASGIKLIILSNAKPDRVAPFAQKLGLGFICMAAKPVPAGILYAAGRLGLRRSECAMVGDQLFTDMLAGHLAAVKTVLLEPVKIEDGWSFRLRRRAEREFRKKYGGNG